MYEKDEICTICNSVVHSDGTVEDCAGECGREISKEQDYVPLSFDEDDVLRDLPDFDADFIDYEFEGD